MKKYIPIILAGCLWGLMGIFVRLFNEWGLGSIEISECRSVFTALILMIYIFITDRNSLKIRFKDIWCFVGTGILSILFFNYCYFYTIEKTTLSFAAILLYTAPIFVMLMSALLFKEKITGRKIVALVLAVTGCALVSEIFSGSLNFAPKYFVVGIGAGIGYALYSIFSRYGIMRGYSPLTITVYTFLFSALGGGFLTDFESVGRVFGSNGGRYLVVAVYALITTILPYILYTMGLKKVENSKASVVVSVEPVTATVVGIILFGEFPSIWGISGIVLILLALYTLKEE